MTGPQFPLLGRRVLVTGGTGFVGSHFVEALLHVGAHVRITVNRRRPVAIDPRIEIVTADLSDRGACEKATAGVDAIIHAAGRVGASGVGPQDELLGIGTNVELSVNVLWAAWKNGIGNVLIFGSSTAYPAVDYPVKENELWSGPPHPCYLGYGWMRRYIEKLAEFVAARTQMRVIIVRPGAIYGPGDNFDPATAHVVGGLIYRAVARETPFVVWGTGKEVRDMLHIRDFVTGCLLALSNGRSCDPINIASGIGITVRELAERVLSAARHNVRINFDASRPVAIPYRVMNIDRAREELGFSPVHDLAEGLMETVLWYRSQLN